MHFKYPSILLILLISLIQVFFLEQLKDPNFLGFLPPFVLVFLGIFVLGWIPFGMYCFGFLEKRKDFFNTTFFTSGLLLSLSLTYQAMQANCSGLQTCTVFEYLDLRGSSQVLIFSIFFLIYGSVFRSKNTFLEIFKNILFILIGIVLSGTLVGVLYLSTNLFGQIEGGSLSDYLDKNILWVLIPSFALFVYEIRKRYSEIYRIFLPLFGWFSIPIFIISGVFVGFLFTSLKQKNLFEGILSSGLYLGFGLVLVTLYNTFLYGFRFVPQEASVHPDPNLEIPNETDEPAQGLKQTTYTSFPIWAYIFRIVPIIMLAFPALATYGLSVRVLEYGWTIVRIWAAVGTVILTVVILSYIFLKNPADIRRSNRLGGWVFIVSTIVLFIPGLTPLELSVKNQVERLLRNDDPEEIYIISTFLRNRGPYGENALEQLLNDNRLTKIQKLAIMGKYQYKNESENTTDIFKKIYENSPELDNLQKENILNSVSAFVKSKEYAQMNEDFHFNEDFFRVYTGNYFRYEIFGNLNEYALIVNSNLGYGSVINLKDYSVKGVLFGWMRAFDIKANQPTNPLSLQSGIRKTQKLNFTYEIWQVDDERFFYVDVPSGSI